MRARTRIIAVAAIRLALIDRLTPIFLARWQAIRAGASLPQAADGASLLAVCGKT
jgi:hypothetical protein